MVIGPSYRLNAPSSPAVSGEEATDLLMIIPGYRAANKPRVPGGCTLTSVESGGIGESSDE